MTDVTHQWGKGLIMNTLINLEPMKSRALPHVNLHQARALQTTQAVNYIIHAHMDNCYTDHKNRNMSYLTMDILGTYLVQKFVSSTFMLYTEAMDSIKHVWYFC